MKKILLIAAGLMLSAGTFAQEGASSGNKMWIGGTAGFNSGGTKDKGDDTNSQSTFKYNVGPSFGYMLNEKMAVGINVMFGADNSTQNNATEDKTANSGYNFQPFFRYYFAGSDNFKFYGDLAVGFGGGNTTWSDNTGASNESKYGTFDLGVTAGAQYWFTPDWSMASSIGLLGYNSHTSNKGQTDAAGKSKENVTSDFGLNATFSTLNFSFFYHF